MVAQQQEAIVGEENSVVIIGQENKNNNMMMIKGKRTKRARPLSPLALTMSTTTTTDEGGSATSEEWTAPNSVATSEEEHDMAHCLILLAQGTNNNNSHSSNTANNNNNNKGSLGISSSYECKTCNKSFASFQALGGHRASHKKPKLNSFASLSDLKKSPSSVIFSLIDHHHHHHDDGTTLSLQMSNSPLCTTTTNNTNKTTKVHECGICGAEFSSGQALGGHMRRHRPIGMSTATTPTASPSENNGTLVNSISKTSRNLLSLDLNLPAPEDEHHQLLQQRDSKFVFSSNEKTLVFAATSSQLVDCHY